MKIIYTDVLVVGGGLAGLRIGIGAKRRGHDVIILSLVPPKRSHSAAAQGGMQASLGNVIKGEGDNEELYFRTDHGIIRDEKGEKDINKAQLQKGQVSIRLFSQTLKRVATVQIISPAPHLGDAFIRVEFI